MFVLLLLASVVKSQGWRAKTVAGPVVFIGVLLALVGAGGGEARADVTGSFALEAAFTPLFAFGQTPVFTAQQTQPVEAVAQLIDVRALTTVRLNVSGLQLQLDGALGSAGLEYVVLSGSTTLGALNWLVQTAFAAPFATVSVSPFVLPVKVGPLLFVTQRTRLSLTLLGVTLSVQAMIDDVNFRHPLATLPLGAPLLPSYTAQSQAFKFGAIASLTAPLPGGAVLTLIEGLNADPFQALTIKGRGFSGRAYSATRQTPSEQLTFVREIVSLQNARVGPCTLGLMLFFDPDPQLPQTPPLVTTASASCSLGATGTISAAFRSPPGGSALPLQLTSVTLASMGWPLTVTATFSNTLEISSITATLSVVLRETPISSLALQLIGAPGTGVQALSAAFLVASPGGYTLTAGSVWSEGRLTQLYARLNAQLGRQGALSVGMTLAPEDLRASRTTLSVRYRF